MTQIVLDIEDTSLIPAIKKLFTTMNGVKIHETKTKKLTGVEEALQELQTGKVKTYKNFKDFKAKVNV